MRIIGSCIAAMVLVSMVCAQSAPSPVAPPSATQPPAPPPPKGAAEPAATQPDQQADHPSNPDPRYGLLTPIPESGGLPPIYSKLYDLTSEEIRHRAAVREYAKQIRLIRHKCFGEVRVEKLRAEGISQLLEFTDPAAFEPMIEELAGEKDDVRLAMLDHFAKVGGGTDEGQAALAFVAIHDKDPAICNEAMRRMTEPLAQPALYIIDRALRSPKAEVANSAAILAGSFNVIQAIPLLIFAQANPRQAGGETGDLAWIAIQTQRAYVAGLQPVVGSGSGAFQPIIGIVSEGVVMRVLDAVVIEYRTIVHTVLVNMTSGDPAMGGWGQPTEPMGYNVRAWWDWYNDEYVPFKNEQAEAAALGGVAGQPPPQPK